MPDTAERPLGFLHLPSELRNEIYHLVLLNEDPITPFRPYDLQQQQLTPGLLRANKAVHREASSLFYGMNCFDLESPLERVLYFLEQIGSDNAGYIRRIVIEFPFFPGLVVDDATLDKDTVRLLATLQSRCTNLTTLSTFLYNTVSRFATLEEPYDQLAAEALQLFDTHLRAISSLQEIILELWQDDMSDQIRQIVESYGWTIMINSDGEDWENSHQGLPVDFDDSDYDYVYDHDHGYDDGYGDDGYIDDNDDNDEDDEDDEDDDIDDY
ncbi:hypothetical protein F4680DRAFT_447121 [Xylaria scruposa]|nr:hypothetical protein F4680DRAFT_447121 [Xylaria scruposa]